jgi:UDP-N-acetylglucosamine 2-epimerase (non-hydrolysing)/GDP/UDP-N,N'-diacetylbacillosamine 2-epimerase (hydrolysing)
MRKISIVSVSRSDYGIYLPLLRVISNEAELELRLIVSGAHLLPEFGNTVNAIEADGFTVAERVEMLTASDQPEGIAQSMGLGLIGFANVYARSRPELLVVLGDRFEMHAAALAALPFRIPVAHIHGGEETVGAIDNSLRHSITKLSHIHFASTTEYAHRLIQLGEEPWRVIVCGAPSLDNLNHTTLLSASELKDLHSIETEIPPLLVTYHPVTLEFEQTEFQTVELLAALDSVALPVIFTMPNADSGGRLIRQLIRDQLPVHPDWQMAENLGTQGYFSVMARAAAMIGNSSSGIIEAASLELPVVNIGTRQLGRLCPDNVINVDYNRGDIARAIVQATSPNFKRGLSGMRNPYGNGEAAGVIASVLKTVPLDEKLLKKPFFDVSYDLSPER